VRTAKTSNLAPGLAQKLDRMNEYELPATTRMILPNETLGAEYSRVVIADLRDRAEQDDHAALWALETIANLYTFWVEATDKLGEIEDILARRRP